MSRRLDCANLTTLHGRLDIPGLVELYAEYGDMPVVSISEAQREPLPHAQWAGTVHHGGPIALGELQGYGYAAWNGAARLAQALGQRERALALTRNAARLRERFEATFWCEELGTYALALDGAKRPCRVRTSNAGHALFSGIASPEHAARTARTLLAADSYSGWGIRTVTNTEGALQPDVLSQRIGLAAR